MPVLFDVSPALDRQFLKRAEWIAAAPSLEDSFREALKAFPGMFVYPGGSHFAVHRKSGESALFKVKEDPGK